MTTEKTVAICCKLHMKQGLSDVLAEFPRLSVKILLWAKCGFQPNFDFCVFSTSGEAAGLGKPVRFSHLRPPLERLS